MNVLINVIIVNIFYVVFCEISEYHLKKMDLHGINKMIDFYLYNKFSIGVYFVICIGELNLKFWSGLSSNPNPFSKLSNENPR